MLMIKDDELMIKKMRWMISVDVTFLDLFIWTSIIYVCLNRTAVSVFQWWFILSCLDFISATAQIFLLLTFSFSLLILISCSLHKAWTIRYECIAMTCQTLCINILCNILNWFNIIWSDINCHIVDDLVLDHNVQDFK
jgi:hypothetical protein